MATATNRSNRHEKFRRPPAFTCPTTTCSREVTPRPLVPLQRAPCLLREHDLPSGQLAVYPPRSCATTRLGSRDTAVRARIAELAAPQALTAPPARPGTVRGAGPTHGRTHCPASTYSPVLTPLPFPTPPRSTRSSGCALFTPTTSRVLLSPRSSTLRLFTQTRSTLHTLLALAAHSMLAKEEESEVDVRWEDQKNIIEFGRHNTKLHVLRESSAALEVRLPAERVCHHMHAPACTCRLCLLAGGARPPYTPSSTTPRSFSTPSRTHPTPSALTPRNHRHLRHPHHPHHPITERDRDARGRGGGDDAGGGR